VVPASFSARTTSPCLMIHDERRPQSLAVLCDFDGTITLTDTFAYILKKYAQGDWQQYDRQYERGELTLQDVVRKQGMMIRTPEMVLVAEMERVTGFRPNFDKLIAYCQTNKIPITVVSAGLDFVINHLLRMKGWNYLVKLYAAKTETTPEGIRLTFPRLRDKTSLDLKDDTVRFHKSKGRRVAYVGDGLWDLPALKLADYRFAVKGSTLANLCRQQNIPAREIADFQEVVTMLKYEITG
jgi:2-hydroxy-3-keto-5-methylthiopentenyl-1-phosphate phosphatase